MRAVVGLALIVFTSSAWAKGIFQDQNDCQIGLSLPDSRGFEFTRKDFNDAGVMLNYIPKGEGKRSAQKGYVVIADENGAKAVAAEPGSNSVVYYDDGRLCFAKLKVRPGSLKRQTKKPKKDFSKMTWEEVWEVYYPKHERFEGATVEPKCSKSKSIDPKKLRTGEIDLKGRVKGVFLSENQPLTGQQLTSLLRTRVMREKAKRANYLNKANDILRKLTREELDAMEDAEELPETRMEELWPDYAAKQFGECSGTSGKNEECAKLLNAKKDIEEAVNQQAEKDRAAYIAANPPGSNPKRMNLQKQLEAKIEKLKSCSNLNDATIAKAAAAHSSELQQLITRIGAVSATEDKKGEPSQPTDN